MAIQSRIGLGALGKTIHPYPTVAEAIQGCGIGYNRTQWATVDNSGRKKLEKLLGGEAVRSRCSRGPRARRRRAAPLSSPHTPSSPGAFLSILVHMLRQPFLALRALARHLDFLEDVRRLGLVRRARRRRRNVVAAELERRRGPEAERLKRSLQILRRELAPRVDQRDVLDTDGALGGGFSGLVGSRWSMRWRR